MPYPSQTDSEQIIEAARKTVIEKGYAHLSFSGLARQLHVKAPSLYRYFHNRAVLLQTINTDTHNALLTEIFTALTVSDDPYERLMAAAHAYRTYATKHPNLFLAAYMANNIDCAPITDRNHMGNAFMQLMKGITDNEYEAVKFFRGLLSLAHGFILHELNGPFRGVQDPDQAYEFMIGAYLRSALTIMLYNGAVAL